MAIQLMRLGEMSNVSHGRTSASTLDDTFSGRADATSSTGATSDGDSESDEEPPACRQKFNLNGGHSIYPTTETEYAEERLPRYKHLVKNTLVHTNRPVKASRAPKAPKTHRQVPSKVKMPGAVAPGPMSPPSLPPSRKQSIMSATSMGPPPTDDDHLDLSSKPRCQRCRKSKKGCDRQRPCARCRDAGIPADQCISEDEGNGRKGRYGRHMGVPLKADEVAPIHTTAALLPAAPIMDSAAMHMGAGVDKSKKRKR